MNGTHGTETERLLRGLASGDETLLRSVMAISPARARSPLVQPAPASAPARSLSPATRALVHLAALLAAGGSTTSLRWGVEIALNAGVRDEEIVGVLATLAAIVGSARVVAAAPRLALAIGYDLEIEGWDGY